MAAHALDNLDEFFDFDQLEHDHGVRTQNATVEHTSPAQQAQTLGGDSAMDWQPTAAFQSDAMNALPAGFVYDSMQYSFASGPPESLPSSSSEQQQTLVFSPEQAVVDGAPSPSEATTRKSSTDQTNVVTSPSDTSPSPASTPPQPSPIAKAHSSQPPGLQRVSNSLRKPASAKRKGASTRIPVEARQMLEEEFAANPYPCSWEIDIIAHQANLDVKRVRNWYNNTRARKKPSDAEKMLDSAKNGSTSSLISQLSRDSLEAHEMQTEAAQPPQPPLAVYLAQSYQEEAVNYSAIQQAIEWGSHSDEGNFQMETSSSSWMGRSGSVVTSITSSDGTAPTTYSSGSNMSSFNRDRRRGRRRMEWKTSPYTRTRVNGLNSAGVPQEDLPFCCTFCPRAFKTKYEWIRHEDSVHALRTTWICCDSKNAQLSSCPFCGQIRPDEIHLASHKYQQCRSKPESQRTFYRRDHFIQHLHHVHFANIKHPSARLGCQAKLMDGEGNNFGCKDLAIKWRRFGAPIKIDDPMLHCGFCGKRSKNWSERCDHVAEHMFAGELDRSAWWPERKENHLENLCHPSAVGPFRCRYCQKVFANTDAMNNHSHCRVWSCRFLRSSSDVAAENEGPPLCPQLPSPKAHHCHLCGAGYRSFHVEHAQHYHRYRDCDQRLYTSEEDFLRHLCEHHGASQSNLMISSHIIEQNFSRNKGASFEPLEFDEILQGCRIGTPRTSFIDPVATDVPDAPPSTRAHATNSRTSSSPARKRASDHVKVPRDRPDTTSDASKPQDPSKDKTSANGPRFFRLSPLVPFLSSRVYYLRSAIPASLFPDGKAVLEEMDMGHVASLVMSAGLVGMAGVRFPVKMKRDGQRGPVEFSLAEDDG